MSNKQFIRASNILSSSSNSQAWSQGYSNSQDILSGGGGSSDNSSSSQGFLSANQRHKELQQILTAIDKATESILSIVLPIKSKLDENTIKLSIVSQQQKALIEALSGVKNDIKQINNSNSNSNSSSSSYNNNYFSSNSESSLTINNIKSTSSPLSRSSNNLKTNSNNNNNVQSEETRSISKAQRTNSATAEEDSVLLDTITTATPKTPPVTYSASTSTAAMLSSSLSTSSQTPTPTHSLSAPFAACSNITDPIPNSIEPSKENTHPNQSIPEDIEISEYLNHRILKNKDKEKDSWNIKRKRDIDEKDPFDEDLFG